MGSPKYKSHGTPLIIAITFYGYRNGTVSRSLGPWGPPQGGHGPPPKESTGRANNVFGPQILGKILLCTLHSVFL